LYQREILQRRGLHRCHVGWIWLLLRFRRGRYPCVRRPVRVAYRITVFHPHGIVDVPFTDRRVVCWRMLGSRASFATPAVGSATRTIVATVAPSFREPDARARQQIVRVSGIGKAPHTGRETRKTRNIRDTWDSRTRWSARRGQWSGSARRRLDWTIAVIVAWAVRTSCRITVRIARARRRAAGVCRPRNRNRGGRPSILAGGLLIARAWSRGIIILLLPVIITIVVGLLLALCGSRRVLTRILGV
jgi:hypothetical protein